MKKVLISACLLGENVKYSGGNNFSKDLIEILNKYNIEFIKVCPEVDAGLSTPREPAEILGNNIITKNGKFVTSEFKKGAELSLKKAKESNIAFAILKEKSPSCGSNFIYDGTFSGKLISGEGYTAKILRENNFKIFSENDLSEIERILKG